MKTTISIGLSIAREAARLTRTTSTDLLIEWMMREVIASLVGATKIAYLRKEEGGYAFIKGISDAPLPLLMSQVFIQGKNLQELSEKRWTLTNEWGIMLALSTNGKPPGGILTIKPTKGWPPERLLEISDWFYENLKTRQELRRWFERSQSDELTGLPNYRACREYLDRKISQLMSGKFQELVLTVVDLDKFKGINDGYGHQIGDRALEKIAPLLSETGFWVGRYGGDEFLMIAPGTRLEIAQRMETLRRDVAEKSHSVLGFQVTLSAGLFSITTRTAQRLLISHGWDINRIGEWIFSIADRYLYRAKDNGRNNIVGYHGR